MGRFEKGAPSANPDGRNAPFKRAVAEAIQKAKQAAGSTGVVAYGGYVQSGESSSALSGRQKYVTYSNAPIRSAPVAIAYLLRHALLGGVKWSLKENAQGGAKARKGVEVVQRGLIDAKLPTPFSTVMARALNGRYFIGFSIHASAVARRKDGLVTYTNLEERPPHTIEKWNRPTPRDPFDVAVQRIDSGETFDIPLAECLYLQNGFLGSQHPEGTGVLRLLVERQRQTGNYRSLEGSELFSGMGGTPIARVPATEILSHASPNLSDSERTALVSTASSTIEGIVRDRIKTPETRQYVVLDSATYQGVDPNTISGIKKWDIEVIKAELAGLTEIRKVISDNDLDDARILGVEFVFVGGGDTRGTFGMHESKVSLFSAQLSADLDIGATAGTQQVCRRIVAANGLDPDEATPSLVPSPISTEDVEKAARTLGLLNMAGLKANHPAKSVFFERMGLPWQDEDEPVLPRAPSPFGNERSEQPNQGNPEDAKPKDEEPGEGEDVDDAKEQS